MSSFSFLFELDDQMSWPLIFTRQKCSWLNKHSYDMYVVLKKEKGLESSTENVHRSLVQNKLGFLLTLQKLFNSLIYSANSNSYFFSHLSNYKWSLVFTGVCGSALLCMGVCRCVCESSGICGYAWVCTGNGQVCVGWKFQIHTFWRLESLLLRTLIHILYKFFSCTSTGPYVILQCTCIM